MEGGQGTSRVPTVTRVPGGPSRAQPPLPSPCPAGAGARPDSSSLACWLAILRRGQSKVLNWEASCPLPPQDGDPPQHSSAGTVYSRPEDTPAPTLGSQKALPEGSPHRDRRAWRPRSCEEGSSQFCGHPQLMACVPLELRHGISRDKGQRCPRKAWPSRDAQKVLD